MRNIIKKYDEIINKVDSLVLDNNIIDLLQRSCYTENRSYLSEYPSIIIYLSYRLANCDDNEHSKLLYNRVNYYLHELLKSIKLNSRNNISMCYGFSGYVYALKLLPKRSKEYSKLLETLETILVSLTRDRLSEIKKSNKVKEEYIDVIQGVSSVGKYFLSKDKLTSNQELLLKGVLNYLAGVINNKPTIYPEYMPNEKLKRKFNMPEYLISLKKGLSYYEKTFQTNKIGKIIGWNGRVSAEVESEKFEYNLSWCYGSLGMARVLYNISKIIDIPKLQELATDVFHSSIYYLNSSEILNNAICHGRSGIMLLFNLMYLDTGESQFKAISDNLFKEIVNKATDSEYIFVERDIYFRGVNYDEVIEYIDFGLLNGVSGIVLALMAQRTGNASPLAEMFFMQ
ncbi:lanthionine synthetase C family protein [Streptococcus pneumoniae]|nr:lanthionine synthetase C family protein [Streptococcus pneumoniae]